MPRTLENHLVGVTADAPHPDSYRPDLPLRNELRRTLLVEEIEAEKESSRQSGFEEGFDDGRDQGRRERAEEVRTLEKENAALRAQLGQPGARTS